jgi:hypothetical protein
MAENIYLSIFKKMIKKIVSIFFIVLFSHSVLYPAVIKQQVRFAPNNISTWFQNTGTFNQDIRTTNTPGFEWPKGSSKFAIFTSGLSIGAIVDGQLRMSNASYNGEYAPGYVFDSSGVPLFKTDSRFRLYSVRIGDTPMNNPDVEAWKHMVPYGAPYDDINNNKKYDVGIDRPGVVDASQTIFLCYTDADPSNHTSSEGFSGGTKPLYAEVHMTAWGYDAAPLSDMQFLRFNVVNKSNAVWDSTYFGFFADPDLGNATDDFIGCDTTLQMIYCYNANDTDAVYGVRPPAVGQTLLRGAINKRAIPPDTLHMTTGTRVNKHGICDHSPSSYPYGAYNYFKGFKLDGTPWLNPFTNPLQTTKFTFTGNPEDSSGWTEKKGNILNCGGSLTGNIEPSYPGDKRMLMSTGGDELSMQHGDSQKIVLGQVIARGSSNLNSVTKLKELASLSRRFYYLIEDDTEVTYVEPPYIPVNYSLKQNYPNPFNPVTTIRYEMKKLWRVKIQIYDTRGELIKTLVNEEKQQGVYEIKFDASNLPSGIYFIKMTSGGGFEDSKKMVVIK